MDLANLPWQAWLYLARQLPHLDAAEALRHAAGCPHCLASIQAIRAGGRPAAPAPAAAAVPPARAATLAGIVIVTISALRGLLAPAAGRRAAVSRPAPPARRGDTLIAAAPLSWHDAVTETRPAIQAVAA